MLEVEQPFEKPAFGIVGRPTKRWTFHGIYATTFLFALEISQRSVQQGTILDGVLFHHGDVQRWCSVLERLKNGKR